jgi:hypothetical protein
MSLPAVSLHSLRPQNNKPGTQHALFGVTPVGTAGGHVAVFGDSNCLDSSHQSSNCHEFLLRVLETVTQVRVLQLPSGRV